mgnify:CR=1 FL=1
MPDDFKDYYGTLTTGQALLDRITHFENQVRTLTPEPIIDVFVSNWDDLGAVPNYLSLFFLTENLLYEIKTFATADVIECDVIRNRIRNLKFEVHDFDFATPTHESRFYVRYVTVNDLVAEFRATGGNCVHLWTLTQKYLIANLETSADNIA